MIKNRILHVYGATKIVGDRCPICNGHAFILSGRFSCCGMVAEEKPIELVKIETDLTGARRKSLSRKEKDRILASQANCCFYCGARFESMRKYKGEYRMVLPQFDHVIPFVYTRLNDWMVAACRECNQHKHSKMFDTLRDAQDYCEAIYAMPN